MTANNTNTALQLRSLIKKGGELELSLVSVAIPEPAPDEVLVRVDASPINPSDLGLLLGAADLSTAKASGTAANPIVTASVPEHLMPAMAGRVDQSMPVGNEGAGVVVKAGASAAAQALLGKTVAILGGAMYAQYRCIKAADCLLLPDDASAVDGASCFVNPLTSQSMLETMRREGHTALVHTAAASNLGQMLNKICIQDKVDLVNIVRSTAQEDILRALGATCICNSSTPSFMQDLTQALVVTGATIAFDAIGGGELAGQILSCMETAANQTAKEYSRYGSTTHKQVYIYGGLDRGPTEIDRNFGMAWSVGGWLLSPFLQKAGPAVAQRLKQRVVTELKTTFASSYAKHVSLAEALQLETMAVYKKAATGEKYLICPNQDLA